VSRSLSRSLARSLALQRALWLALIFSLLLLLLPPPPRRRSAPAPRPAALAVLLPLRSLPSPEPLAGPSSLDRLARALRLGRWAPRPRESVLQPLPARSLSPEQPPNAARL
ncbi:hypothetical protein H1C71_022856, partial [Ictidomys tridecemlineatus]